MSDILYAAILTLTVGQLVTALLLSPRFRGLAVDLPNERSLHKTPTPRTGGLGILAGATAGVALVHSSESATLWVVALCLGAVSFADDRWSLSIGLRFAAQFLAAIVVMVRLSNGQPLWWVGSAVFATVWMTNLYNFMDGADGLAGGMGAIGFGAYSVAAWTHGAPGLAALSACLATGCTAFLRYNFPPAKIFMGDVGSTVLGFSAATLGAYGESVQLWPRWFPFLAFLPFISDASVTILKRAVRRERIWRAHREHYYQRLVLSGWNHARLAKSSYALMLGTAASAVLALQLAPALGWAALAAWCLIIGALMFAIDARWLRHTRTHQGSGA